MYRDQGRFSLGRFPNQFRDMLNQNLIQVSRVKGKICFFSASADDGQQVYLYMTDYEADQLLQHLQKLLDEK